MTTVKTYGWFKVYWDFMDKLTPESALFLSYLIDIQPMMKKWDGEYFRLSNSFIQERFITWSNYTIKTRIDELVSKGYIDTQERYEQEFGTKHKTRWVKINPLPEDLIKPLT